MSDHPIPDWDPQESAVLGDQRQAYDAIRERCPVAHSDFLAVSLFRHQDIVDVLADTATYSNIATHRAVPNSMDPPEHARYRHALEPYFERERMLALEPQCRQIAVELVRELRAGDEGDFVAAFALPFSFKTLCTFLGWPSALWVPLADWAQGTQATVFSQDREAASALAREFTGYVMEALRVRRTVVADVADDLTTGLMATMVEGATLPDTDIVSLLRNWTAGHSTVAAALGIIVSYLAAHADVQERLRREPTLLPAALDEILRVDGPLVANGRTTTRDVTIGGRAIAAGERLTLNWIAANRDGRVFDEPAVVCIDRDPGSNLVFGAGIHYCLGAPLAHLELRVAIEALLLHTTMIEFAATGVPQRDVYPSNGFVALPVRLR